MKETLEGLEQFAIEVILNRRRGAKAAMLRFFLGGLSKVLTGLVLLRLRFYRTRVLRENNLGCMVISIGNLTVGGTGKTPVVEMFARALTDGGRRVAILESGIQKRETPLAPAAARPVRRTSPSWILHVWFPMGKTCYSTHAPPVTSPTCSPIT